MSLWAPELGLQEPPFRSGPAKPRNRSESELTVNCQAQQNRDERSGGARPTLQHARVTLPVVVQTLLRLSPIATNLERITPAWTRVR
jgi:hypothetical protein